MSTPKVDLSVVKPTEHISFTSADAVKQICAPLFKKLGLNAFSYSRIYADGSRAELWSDPLALEHTFIIKNYLKNVYSPDFFKNVRRCMYENQVKDYAPNVIDQYAQQLGDQREFFDHDNCFLIIRRCIQYTEYFIFYAPRKCTGAVNIYFNYLEELENFADYFLIQANDLVKAAVKERLIQAWRRVEPPSRSIGHVLKKDPLSPKEACVALLIVQGKSAKEIAIDLKISPKTAEYHIANIKIKLDVNKKSNLVQKLYQMGIRPL